MNFFDAIDAIIPHQKRSLDTETTGLRPYHGDRLFSVIIGTPQDVFYFNFLPYAGLETEKVLTSEHLKMLQVRLFDDLGILWFIHNAKFDMAILKNEGLELHGKIWCTKALGRVEYNERPKYSLEKLAPLVGEKKSEAVDEFVMANGLYENVTIPGKKKKVTIKHFDRVPFSIIEPYGEQDGRVGLKLGFYQENSIEKQSKETPAGLPPVRNVSENECRLTKTVARMEHLGVRIDKDYCVRAAQFERDRAVKASEKFKKETGRDYLASGKLFVEVFADQRERWSYTEDGNPSFDADALKLLQGPIAEIILELRDAKSKSDFYNGFLYHADSRGIVHPNFNPDGARHGRFSSSDPNLQNLTKEEDEALNQEFVVRRAIIPPPGYIWGLLDYDQMEYRLMLDVAADLLGHTTPLIELINGGLDVHNGTVEVCKTNGVTITRTEAKTSNFLTVYGGGDDRLADQLKIALSRAKQIRGAILRSAPEISNLTSTASQVARTRGFIRNWLGRRCYFPNRRFAYRAANSLIAGGCADIVKVAMNQIDELLLHTQTKMVLTIHDELVFQIPEKEHWLLPEIKSIMENVYPSKYLKLTCGLSWSDKNLADKTEGMP